MKELNLIRETYPRISELNEIVGLYEIHVEEIPQVLKIKVLRIGNVYIGVANLQVKFQGAINPYRSLQPQDTKEAALKDAISGFFAFLKEGSEISEVEDW